MNTASSNLEGFNGEHLGARCDGLPALHLLPRPPVRTDPVLPGVLLCCRCWGCRGAAGETDLGLGQ